MLVSFLKEDFKFSDDRGDLIQLIHDGFKQVNYITARSGCIRGGHYHKLNIEAFFVISGSFVLEVSRLGSSETKEIYNMKQGDFFCIYPEVVHSFNFTADTQLISMYSQGVEIKDGKKDILTCN